MKHRKSKFLFRTKDFAQSREYFDIYWDDLKKVGWTDLKNTDNIEKYYSQNYCPHSLNSVSLQDRFYKMVRRWMCWVKWKMFRSFLNVKHPKILDFGAGTGYFADYLKKRGLKVDLVESNQNAYKQCQEKGHSVYLNLCDVPSNASYQVITLWHVLEHLPNPWNEIKELDKLLEDNGVLVIAVPNFKSFDAKKYKDHWAALDVPRHLWHFTPSGLLNLLEQAGFKLVKKRTLFFDSFYISQLSEKYKGSKLWIVKGLFFGAISNVFGQFTGNFSSMVFIAQKNLRNYR